MTRPLDPDLDLTIARIIKAPRAAIWAAWTEPARFQQWWLPAPTECRIVEMEVVPGGALVTHMRDGDGPFVPHFSGCYLALDPLERIVFTNALTGGWRPAERGFMTATILLRDHPQGTAYSALAMHRNPADRKKHEEMGFHDGWGAVTEQLARLVE